MKIALNLQNCTLRRVVWGSWLLCTTAILVIARMLHPSPLGYGSHLQLGLPPCGFLIWSGMPCPSCGLTTSFAHLLHLQWIEAWHANPWGFFLLATLVLSVPVAAVGLLRALPILATLEKLHTNKLILTLLGIGLLSWGLRLQ
ncbi:MAG: DUF2752 domain-containing protein [Myxococcales bacterium]|nr:MAG: DUF2752 domain-containing protein [Myxococcales bacterium]